MLIANLVVVLIIAGCVAYQYLKGTLVKAFAMIIVTICASIVAFGFFEALAGLFISGRDSSFKFLPPPWMQMLSFVLLFLFTFAGLQTLAEYLTRQQVDLGLWPERIGRVVCGIFLGLILSGILFTALALAPLPNKYPYQRFEQGRPDAENPNKPLLNPDGFATGWFSIISNGSLSGKRSFATLHPAFLDQLFLNRHNIDDNVPLVTSSQAIKVPAKNAAWYAPEGIKDQDDNPVQPKSVHNLMFLRVGIKRTAVRDAGTFTLSQLRLICKTKRTTENPLAGKGKNIYPIGYLIAANKIQIKRLNEVITVTSSDFQSDASERWIDFAFHVPNDSVPVLVEFKQNCVVQVSPPVTAEQAPPPAPFIPTSEREKQKDTAEPNEPSQAHSPRQPREQTTPTEKGGLSPISRTLVGPQLDDYK